MKGVKNMRINVEKIKNKMDEAGKSNEQMAKELSIDPSTFYRKMKSEGENFTVGQMHKIIEVLKLEPGEAATIFLWGNSQ